MNEKNLCAETYCFATVALFYWGAMRRLAAIHGLHLEESNGWFYRSFVFRGKVEAVKKAYLVIVSIAEKVNTHD